ncbi:MAG TPA: TauD/TfdA family dioxygenase [Burkholderiales bacterium]|nr:TauD/TfdA family dioxygenase [Burkholderiales bacterium]
MTKPSMPPGAIAGAAAWYGRDLAAREHEWLRRFSAEELAELDQAVHAFCASAVPLTAISPATFPLPTLGAVLRDLLRELLEGRGFVLLRGFPVERYSRAEQAIAYLGLGSYLGAARSQNAKGHLLGHVKDLGLDIRNPNVRYYQTNRKLEYHTDSVDIVGLLCLKAAKSGGESFLASSMTLYNEIRERRPDLLPALFEPYPTDRRGEVPEGMQPWFDIPVFHWHAGRLSCIYVRQYIEAAQRNFPAARRLTQAQLEAMDLMDELANDPKIHLSMEFRPGDMQFLHNHQILHSRNDFENWPEPERHRHLLRLWLAPNEARPLPEVFAPRYGSVAPGERGGIVVRGTKLSVALEAE